MSRCQWCGQALTSGDDPRGICRACEDEVLRTFDRAYTRTYVGMLDQLKGVVPFPVIFDDPVAALGADAEPCDEFPFLRTVREALR